MNLLSVVSSRVGPAIVWGWVFLSVAVSGWCSRGSCILYGVVMCCASVPVCVVEVFCVMYECFRVYCGVSSVLSVVTVCSVFWGVLVCCLGF